jgi:hypothetical protein
MCDKPRASLVTTRPLRRSCTPVLLAPLVTTSVLRLTVFAGCRRSAPAAARSRIHTMKARPKMTTPWSRRAARRPLAPRVAVPREPVDPARIGRRSVRRRAKGMDAGAVTQVLEEARFDAWQDARHEHLADDERGRAELAEWERIDQLLADTAQGTVYDPDSDDVAQAELVADAAAAAAPGRPNYAKPPGSRPAPMSSRRCASSAHWSRPNRARATKQSGTNSHGGPARTYRRRRHLARPRPDRAPRALRGPRRPHGRRRSAADATAHPHRAAHPTRAPRAGRRHRPAGVHGPAHRCRPRSGQRPRLVPRPRPIRPELISPSAMPRPSPIPSV